MKRFARGIGRALMVVARGFGYGIGLGLAYVVFWVLLG